MTTKETKERERIISLINLYREHHDFGTSLQLGRLIDGIRGEDRQFIEWLEKSTYTNSLELKRRVI